MSLFSETDRIRTQQRSPEQDPPRFLDRLDSRLDPYPLAYDPYEERDTRRHGEEIEKVWIFGTGEMKDLRDMGRQSSLGADLGLLEKNIMLYWYCKRGLKFRDILPALHKKLEKGFTPQCIILHCGGNDLNELADDLEEQVRRTVDEILNELPGVKIVWSMILPRWLGPGDVSSQNRKRNSINDTVARFILELGGCYLKYPDISLRDKHLYRESGDGDLVLSYDGQERLLETLKGGIVSILHRGVTIHPELKDLEPLVSEYVSENVKFGKFAPLKQYARGGSRGRGRVYRGSSRGSRVYGRGYRGRGRGRLR